MQQASGHKLQGQTKESLLISAWYYGKNLPYVVILRVRWLSRLFLGTEKLNPTHNFSLNPRLVVCMLSHMRWKVPKHHMRMAKLNALDPCLVYYCAFERMKRKVHANLLTLSFPGTLHFVVPRARAQKKSALPSP
jgi:hypothetical protein